MVSASLFLLLSPSLSPTVPQDVPKRQIEGFNPTYQFGEESPKLVVLVHGMTSIEGDPQPDTLGYVRYYFSRPFCSALIPTSGSLFTASGTSLPNANDFETKSIRDSRWDDHFLVSDAAKATALRAGTAPDWSILLTKRKGSAKLIPQTKEAIAEIYDMYQAAFRTGKRPQIILVAHSMGGLVSRTILSNPTDAIGGTRLTEEERKKADFIRDRTAYLVTLATPHEGSKLATKIDGIKNFFAADNSATKLFKDVFRIPNVRRDLFAWAGSNDAVEHLRTEFWQDNNRGPLHPRHAVRTDGTAIPIYTLTGRQPAADSFTDKDAYPLGGLNIANGVGRTEFERLGLMAADWGMYQLPTRSTWGSTSDSKLDRIRRGFVRVSASGGVQEGLESIGGFLGGKTDKKNSTLVLSAPRERPGVTELGLPMFYVPGADGEIDADGFVAIDSGAGYHLGTPYEEYYDHSKRWLVGGKPYNGTWYRFYSGPFETTNHGNVMRSGEVGGWLRTTILDSAGPYASTQPLSIWRKQ